MPLVEWIGSWPGAVLLQRSGTAYLLVNAAHIAAVGLLIGSILPLDLRLIGFFRGVPLPVIGPFLSRMAAVGVALAIVTGLWLFTVKPGEYLGNAAFLCKVALLTLALANVVLQHRSRHFRVALAGGDVRASVRVVAGFSAVLWLSALVAGRWIGFL
ncbi:MAG: DUF2214 domain-containing protein [Alphaproteobacteria bacterium 65-37]|jgi:hypothetical protein|nr:DUF2214 domain-containing protein [Alphaproteobacteria bacterium]OJU44953.1 MAG: DUF2214 domain-containing protein [Alphaproteobacteria bacterium 65-37]